MLIAHSRRPELGLQMLSQPGSVSSLAILVKEQEKEVHLHLVSRWWGQHVNETPRIFFLEQREEAAEEKKDEKLGREATKGASRHPGPPLHWRGLGAVTLPEQT